MNTVFSPRTLPLQGNVTQGFFAVLKDELFGFLLAGHETSSTTIAWGLKLLTDHQDVQHKLREAMRSAMPEAVGETANLQRESSHRRSIL